MFKVFGHPDVSILDGGFPMWEKEVGEVEKAEEKTDSYAY